MKKLLLLIALFTIGIGLAACQEVTVEGLEVTPPSKVNYVLGESFNPSGLEVKLVYSDGTFEMIEASEFEVSGFNPNTLGLQTIKVEYDMYEAHFGVAVLEPEYIKLPPLAPYVTKSSDESLIADIPEGGVVFEKDFTVATPVTSFEGTFASNVLTYNVAGLGTVESRGFNNEAQLPKLTRQDQDGLHINVTNLGEWSNNGEVRLMNVAGSNIAVTAGAFYTVFVEVKWLGSTGSRPLRMIYAGKDNSNANWGDSANNLEIGSEFVELKHNEFFIGGVTGSAATINNSTRLDLRLGWMGNLTKFSETDSTLVIKSLKIIRGATSSIHTTTPEGSIRAYAMGGQNPVYDGTFMSLFIAELGEGSHLPAIAFTGLQLVNGTSYQLQFQHEALRRRSVEVFIGYYDEFGRLRPLKDAPDTVLMDSFSSRITETWNFTWEGESIHDAILVFNYGDVGEFNALTTVKVGNVSLIES